MATVCEIVKQVSASPERVFAVCTDFANITANIPSIKKMEILTPGPVGKGTRFRETRVMFGKEATETMEIADFVPGRSVSISGFSCGTRFLTRFDFHSEGSGTRVEMKMEFTPETLFAKLMSPLGWLMAGSMKKVIEQDLDDVKAVAEGRKARPAKA